MHTGSARGSLEESSLRGVPKVPLWWTVGTLFPEDLLCAVNLTAGGYGAESKRFLGPKRAVDTQVVNMV